MGDEFPCSSFVDAPPGPRTNNGFEVRFGRKREKGVSFAFRRVSGVVKEVWRVTHWTRRRNPTSASVPEGGKRSDSGKRAMPPTCAIAVVCNPDGPGSDMGCFGRREETNHVRRHVVPSGAWPSPYARSPASLSGALHTSLCLLPGGFS